VWPFLSSARSFAIAGATDRGPGLRPMNDDVGSAFAAF
jgi:hypothetical protein